MSIQGLRSDALQVFYEEMPAMIRIAAPSVVVAVFNFMIWFLNTLFAAQLGEARLGLGLGIDSGELAHWMCAPQP